MADPLDLLSLDDGKDAINMASTNQDHDAEIARHITTISRIIDDACGPVVVRTVTEVHEVGGQERIWLNRPPVLSITTVREYASGVVSTLDAVAFGAATDGYSLTEGALARRLAGVPYVWGGAVEVVYEAGRYADTESVDERFADTAAAVLRRLWKREAGTWAQASSIFEGDDAQAGTGFFRVARPIIEEMLHGEIRDPLPGIG